MVEQVCLHTMIATRTNSRAKLCSCNQCDPLPLRSELRSSFTVAGTHILNKEKEVRCSFSLFRCSCDLTGLVPEFPAFTVPRARPMTCVERCLHGRACQDMGCNTDSHLSSQSWQCKQIAVSARPSRHLRVCCAEYIMVFTHNRPYLRGAGEDVKENISSRLRT